MNFGKCPGQDTRNWKHEDIYEDNCPNCGEEMEFWKTDLRVKCRSCGTKVVNRRFNLNCAAWCAYAEQCLGSAADQLKPDSIRKKIEERAGGILVTEELERLLGEAETALEEAKGQRVNMPVLIGSLYFSAIAKERGESEANEIIDDMVDSGDLPPQIADGIKEEVQRESVLV